MKILFDHSSPFFLAHGGFQIQIEETKRALEKADVEVEFVRWWDPSQTGSLIHFFGLPQPSYVELARNKGIRVVVSQLLGGLGARSEAKRFAQKIIIRSGLKALPRALLGRLGWRTWQIADACIALTSWEAGLMKDVFGVPENRVFIVPNGVSEVFFAQPSVAKNKYLVTTASILPVKRLLETAKAAVQANTPYWIIGRPFDEKDSYYQNFVSICRRSPNVLRYDDRLLPQAELARVYAQVRGFVLLSRWESQSLSALEAAACECPLLLSDLPWARSTFGENANYCPVTSIERTADCLRSFYDRAPDLNPPPKPATWAQVAQMLKKTYGRVLGGRTE